MTDTFVWPYAVLQSWHKPNQVRLGIVIDRVRVWPHVWSRGQPQAALLALPNGAMLLQLCSLWGVKSWSSFPVQWWFNGILMGFHGISMRNTKIWEWHLEKQDVSSPSITKQQIRVEHLTVFSSLLSWRPCHLGPGTDVEKIRETRQLQLVECGWVFGLPSGNST